MTNYYNKPNIYLDMDGVIADFFGALEKHYKVEHWKDLPNIEETLKDLKGTDFFGNIPKFKTSYTHRICRQPNKWRLEYTLFTIKR